MHRRITALAIAAIALFGLTACTGTASGAPSSPSGGASAPADGAAGGQSVAEACGLIQETIAGATGEFESAASADPATIVEAMKTAATKVADAASQVTNDEVAALLPSLEQMFVETSELMQALVDGDVTKLGELSEVGESFQETTQRFQELCAG